MDKMGFAFSRQRYIDDRSLYHVQPNQKQGQGERELLFQTLESKVIQIKLIFYLYIIQLVEYKYVFYIRFRESGNVVFSHIQTNLINFINENKMIRKLIANNKQCKINQFGDHPVVCIYIYMYI